MSDQFRGRNDASNEIRDETQPFSVVWNLASIIVTVVIHSIGTVVIVAEWPPMFRFTSQEHRVISGQLVIAIVVIELLILHLIEIGFWGLCLCALGLFTGLGESLYFAGISYTSLGYSGNLPPSRIRFPEVLISIAGLLMFGWSVGILVTTVLQYEKVALGWDPSSDPSK